MGRLEGKSIVITGAGSGIGRAASLMFTKEGAKLLAVDKTDGVDETVKLVRAAGGTAEAMKADAGSEQEVAAFVGSLLFLHGNGASADWWSFIAPFFADTYRVAAFSMSGMGGSGWRDKYSHDLYVDEAFAVAESTGLFAASAKPVVIGHSFGAFITSGIVGRAGGRIGGAIMLDGPFLGSAARKRQRELRGAPRPKRIYDTMAQALSRFRFAPDQPCENLFIADWIARSSIRKFRRADDSIGYTWCFDPLRFMGFRHGSPANDLSVAQCPIAVIGAERSGFVTEGRMYDLVPYIPKGSPLVVMPDSDHHIMADQPLALVAALRMQLANWG